MTAKTTTDEKKAVPSPPAMPETVSQPPTPTPTPTAPTPAAAPAPAITEVKGEAIKGEESKRGIDLSKLKPKELLRLIEGLPPEAMTMVRGAAAKAGLPVTTTGDPSFGMLPNGDARVTIQIPADLVPALQEWAGAAGEPFEVFLRRFTVEAITAYTQMDWQNMAQ